MCTRGRIHGFKSGGGRERGAEGAGGVDRVGMGRGFPLPSRLRGLGERHKLRQRVPGRSTRRPPATLNFFLHFGDEEIQYRPQLSTIVVNSQQSSSRSIKRRLNVETGKRKHYRKVETQRRNSTLTSSIDQRRLFAMIVQRNRRIRYLRQ